MMRTMATSGFVFNAEFYFSTQKNFIKDNFFEPRNGFLKIETISDTQTLLLSKVGEVRMIASFFNPDEVYQQSDSYLSFRHKVVYTSAIKSLEIHNHMIFVTTCDNSKYCVLLGDPKS